MKICVFVILFFTFFIDQVYASSVTLNTSRSEITHDQEFIVQSSLSIKAGDGTSYYLRGVFFKEGTSDYCGLTWNGSEWFSGPYSSGEGWKKFLKVQITNNSWSGELKAKIDPEDSGCQESGLYKFKIQRFVEGSGSSTFDDQEMLNVQILVPTPTPIPLPTLKPSPTPKPSPTSKPLPTVKPTSQKTNSAPTVTTDKKVLGETIDHQENLDLDMEENLVDDEELGDPNELLLTATKEGEEKSIYSQDTVDTEKESRFLNSSTFSLGGGVILLFSSCGILVMKKLRKYNDE